jgi:hypothetical protein
MRRAPDVSLRNILRVAAETSIERLLRSEVGESPDGGFAAFGFDVIAARAVASFACLLRARVRVFIEIQRYVGVTGLAYLGANVPVRALQQQRQKH